MIIALLLIYSDFLFISGSTVSFIIPRSVGSSYAIGLGQTISTLDWDSVNTEVLCEVDQGKETHFNDAKCDASGRLWAGDLVLHFLQILHFKHKLVC